MKNFALGLFLGIIVGAIGGWYYLNPPPSVPSIATIKQQTEEVAENAADRLQAKLEALDLTSEDIRKELDQKGRIVRRSAREIGAQLADAAVDAKITAAIQAQFVRDPELSVWDISVNTTDRKVTLSGTVGSPPLVAKAILYALQTDNVDMVVSSIQITNEAAEGTNS